MRTEAVKIRSLLQLYDTLPEQQRLIVDVLRSLVNEQLKEYGKEKISYNVPYFYGRKGICIIWPSAIPRGGIKKGVLFGFWYGNRLKDPDKYLIRGSNKQIYYRIYNTIDEVSAEPIIKLLKEAVTLDRQWTPKK